MKKKNDVATGLPKRIKVAYALGQLGWSILSGIIGVWLVWFYFPPQGVNIPASIPQGAIFGGLTVIGLITMSGRFFDAITDPLIANFSDKSKNKRGRRISFMRMGAIPFALLTLLVFVSPVSGISGLNVAWLTICLLLYYLFFTIYVTPYFALMSELGSTPEERLDLSTYISLTWFIGMIIASAASGIWPFFENMGYSKVLSIQITFGALSVLGLIFLLIPVLMIDEKKYVKSEPNDANVFQAMLSTFKNKNFLIFTFSDLAYWLALTMFQSGTIYFTTVLLPFDEGKVSLVTALVGIGSFLCYPAVNVLAKKMGKKKLINVAFILLMIAFAFCAALGKLGISPDLQLYGLIVIMAIPMAIFGILPNAIISDIAGYDAHKTGYSNEAMFFGARTFMSKMGQMLAMLSFTSLLLLGKDTGNDLGIRMAAILSVVLAFMAFLLFLRYDEKEILSIHSELPSESKKA